LIEIAVRAQKDQSSTLHIQLDKLLRKQLQEYKFFFESLVIPL